MAVRLFFELGHEASLRSKNPEGFTHDWKVYLRGCDGANIQHYVDRVIFYLHDTFLEPKRVVTEPPYHVKESGYAGFTVQIEVFLRNNGEPKKLKLSYDLILQPTGFPASHMCKERVVIISPPEDFKAKLLKGGGSITSYLPGYSGKSIFYEDRKYFVSRTKPSASDAPPRKSKMEPHISNSFQELFGPPITKTTRMSEPKAPAPKENKTVTKPEKEKSVDKAKSKHSPHKDKDKDRDREKSGKRAKEEKKREKEKKERDRDRSKTKNVKKDKSPSPRNPSPKASSPPPQAVHTSSAGKSRDKEGKGEKEKKDKVDKEEKKAKKEKKEKEHTKDKDKHRDSTKSEHRSKETKPKEVAPPPKEPENTVLAPPVPVVSPPQTKSEKKDKPKDEEKSKVDRIDETEDKKHKHKKKDRSKKDRKDKEEKSHRSTKKAEKEKNAVPLPVAAPPPINVTSVNGACEVVEKTTLFGSSPKTETSSVTSSPKEKEKPSKPLNKLFSTFLNQPSESSSSSREPSPIPTTKKKEKTKKSDKKNNEKSAEKKKKRKSSSDLDQPPEKVVKEEENVNNNSDMEVHSTTIKPEPLVLPNTEAEDYMSILRSLQHKIMALKDNADLQKIVQLIAETGQYEISANTFDFDLCLLDRSTVRQLQDFLSTTS